MFFSNEYKWTDKNFMWTFEVLGGSPVVIAVSHDRGFHPSNLDGFFEYRKNGVRGQDAHVWTIAKDILLKANVNAVRGLFPRHFIDYNRSVGGASYGRYCQSEAEPAFDDEKLKIIYDGYHQAISNLVINMIQIYGKEKCLLIDLHGFTRQPAYGEYDLIFGTGNRATVNSDIDKLFAEFMTIRGYSVFLPSESVVIAQKDDKYDAGFTTRHYAKKFMIDAIQIEIAKKFRILEGGDIGRKLSNDMAEFFNSHFGF